MSASSSRYATLGRTGLKVTKYILGSMLTSDLAVIERAVDLGVNCFATARDYQNGNNERLLGAAIKSKRKELVLITGTADASRRESKEDLAAQLNTSLRELRTDFVDVWLLQNRSRPEQITDNHLEFIQSAKKEGKIRFGGVTTHRLPAVADFIVNTDEIDVVMPIYNFAMDARMHATIARVHGAQRGIIAMKVMAGGLRANPPLPQFQRQGALIAALKWAFNHPYVDAAVTSATDADQVEQNVRAMSSPFTKKDRELLARAADAVASAYCRNCGRCDGACPNGLPVADILRYAAYAGGYGQFALGRAKFSALPESVRSVRCRVCERCAVRCPFGVEVAAGLARAQSLFA